MAWCPYCRTHTVNGRCPSCNRMYTEPNKSYDYYGKEIKGSSSNDKNSVSYTAGPYFWPGFFLGLFANFISIIIAHYKSKDLMKGAIVGTIFSSFLIINVITIIILLVFNLFEIS